MLEEDYGQFNESFVYTNPLKSFLPSEKLINPLLQHNNPEQNHLGIYEGIKLSSFQKSRQGKVVQLVSLDSNSLNAFVTHEGIQLLEQYPTDQIAFAMVVGNKSAGKSFFCDKILNLSQIKGNHFCKSHNLGINVWSSPFEKEDLKIFLMEISGCDLDSQQFKLLSTYAVLIGSAFIVIQGFRINGKTSLEQLEDSLDDIIGKITPSRLKQAEEASIKRSKFMPEFYYYLKRREGKQEIKNLSLISSYIEEYLSDAKAKTYQGPYQQLVHLSFLDTKCINEEYIRKVSHIFQQMYSVITEKRYNQLLLNGNLIVKILKYVEGYLNSKYQLDIDTLYGQVIEDLYQSAYNFCILSYHEEMEKELEDEHPKSFDQLLNIFLIVSDNVLQKFQQFSLDERLHQIYQQKLERHINQKEVMITDINKLKTERIIMQSYEPSQLTNGEAYRAAVKKVNSQYPNLTHGRAEGLGKINVEFFKRLKNVDTKVIREIERLSQLIDNQQNVLTQLKEKNLVKIKQKTNMNKQQQQLVLAASNLDNRKIALAKQIQQLKDVNKGDLSSYVKQTDKLEGLVQRNIKTLEELKRNQKSKEILTLESKIEQYEKNNAQLQKILSQLKNNKSKKEIEGEPEKGKAKQKKK